MDVLLTHFNLQQDTFHLEEVGEYKYMQSVSLQIQSRFISVMSGAFTGGPTFPKYYTPTSSFLWHVISMRASENLLASVLF